MREKFLWGFVGSIGTLLLTATNGFSYGSYGDDVNSACSPVVPYSANDCALCHTANRGEATAATQAYNAGQLVDFFCLPITPTCTDNDNDTFAVEGGDCGPVDCDDTDAAINPGATENCSDTIDNNCDGLIDALDPAAIGCLVCTDSDDDNFALQGGECGPVDCNDTNAAINPEAVDIPNNTIDENCDGADSVEPSAIDTDGDGYNQAADCDGDNAAINPGAIDIPNNGIDENCDGTDSVDTTDVDNDGDGFTLLTGDCDDTDAEVNPRAFEICADRIDNNCNGLVDIQDPNAIDCPVTCIDNDGDTYAIEGGECGPVDCNDNDAAVHPGSEETCGDAIDNDCDSYIDEGCDATCPDLDGDGFKDAACGGMDCNDTDANVNPGAREVCGNGFDENCNGTSDDTCLTCPDGTLLVIKKMKYHRGDQKLHIKGRATVGTSVTIMDADTEKNLAENITVKKGKWEAEIKDAGRVLKNITVFTSNGCAVTQQINNSKERDNHNDRRNHYEDDDEQENRHEKDHRKNRH